MAEHHVQEELDNVQPDHAQQDSLPHLVPRQPAVEHREIQHTVDRDIDADGVQISADQGKGLRMSDDDEQISYHGSQKGEQEICHLWRDVPVGAVQLCGGLLRAENAAVFQDMQIQQRRVAVSGFQQRRGVADGDIQYSRAADGQIRVLHIFGRSLAILETHYTTVFLKGQGKKPERLMPQKNAIANSSAGCYNAAVTERRTRR